MKPTRYQPDPLVTRIEHLLRDLRLIAPVGLILGVLPVVLIWALLAMGVLQPILASQFWFSVLLIAAIIFIILHLCGGATLAERKIASFIQDRKGPNRVGFWGVLQPLADGIKFILKEDIIPGNVDKPTFILAPFLAFVIGFITFAVIPWAGEVRWPWMAPDAEPIRTQVASLDIGFLYILAVSSLSVYGVVIGGWASNNKYSFYGGMRATAQMLSYEVPLGLGLLIILLTSGSLRLETIVADQVTSGWWYIFLQPVAFLLVLVSAFAETNRTPFDLAEAEQELVGGYHTEYSAMKLALFLLTEYAHMTINGALIMVVFFGGYAPLPWLNFGLGEENVAWWAMLLKFAILWGKISLMLGFYMLIRWTIPRFRFDQLMKMAWKGLVPAGILMVILSATLVVFDLHTTRTWWAPLGVNLAVIVLALVLAGRSKTPITGRQENMPELSTHRQQAAVG